VPQAGGDDDSECGAAVERERVQRDGERQTRVDEHAEVYGRELAARHVGRRWEDERLFFGLDGRRWLGWDREREWERVRRVRLDGLVGRRRVAGAGPSSD